MAGTYLVTGGAGFIGRYLCEELLSQGHHVRVVDGLIEQVHGSSASTLSRDVEFIQGDIRDAALIDAALIGVDGVFHLAAEVGVGQSMYEIARYVGANDLGTAILLERLIARPVRRLVVASSMSVYGEGLYRTASGADDGGVRRVLKDGSTQWDPLDADGGRLVPVPTDETKPVDLASVYAVTKFVQERNSLIVSRAYGMEAVALRLFNVYGPGQALSNPYTGVLAIFASRLLHRERPLVFEDGEQRRDFVHVKDVADAFMLALEHPAAAGQVFNIGSGHDVSILEVAAAIAGAMGLPHLTPEVMGKARTGDIRHCFADIGLAGRALGFQPKRSFDDSLGELVEWVRRQQAVDLVQRARQELETRGLVA